MDDAGSILLLLTRGPSTSSYYTDYVPEYSWHFGSRGRPYTIYGPAYRTFSAEGTRMRVYAHTRAPILPRRAGSVITRIRLRARDAGQEFNSDVAL